MNKFIEGLLGDMIGEEETLKKRLKSSVEKTSEEVERLCKDLIIVDEYLNKTGIDPEFSFQPILTIWEESYHVKGNAFIDVGLQVLAASMEMLG